MMAPLPGEGSLSATEHAKLCDDFVALLLVLCHHDRQPISVRATPLAIETRAAMIAAAGETLQRLTLPF